MGFRAALLLSLSFELALPACQGRAEEGKPVSTSACNVQVEPATEGSLYEALMDAPDGAVLCLAPGTYRGTLHVGRSVVLRASGEPGSAVLDARGEGPVLGITEAGITVRLEGLTLTGGFMDFGGAIPLEVRSEVQLHACVLRGNRTGDYGGGALYARRGRFVLSGCTLLDNEGKWGGAILADGVSDWEIEGTAIRGNRGVRGGAVAIRDGARVAMRGCTVQGNSAKEGDGAAVFLEGTTTRGPELAVKGCTIDEPSIHDEGGRSSIVRE